ncbi:DUF805 domain-containing protein [Yersinia sp. 2541 StPb PI]|uniref:DUF805 domain-containing protein n=1 Tax=Yersinia sp. 2541 StPb PI TaxID=3117407 RepID=UPI003FA47F1A
MGMGLAAELFCEVRDGRLGRVRFLVCYITTFILPLLIALFTGVPLFLAYESANASNFITAILGCAIVVMAFFLVFASANIEAKRFRDIGLPGWSMFTVHTLLGIISQFSENYLCIFAFTIYLLIFLCLFCIPTNFFGSKA